MRMLRLLADRGRKRGERALESQVLEGFGPQPAGDPTDVLGSLAGGLAQLVELFAQVFRDHRGQALDLQHHAGERLADLVVQLAGDPAAARPPGPSARGARSRAARTRAGRACR